MVHLVDLGVLLAVLYSVDSVGKAEPWVDGSFDCCHHLVVRGLLCVVIESTNWNKNGAQMVFLENEIAICNAFLNI